jgi:hypothetical protein
MISMLARNVLAHLDRLHRVREVKLPANLSQAVHQGRMAQLAREGAQMSAQHCPTETTDIKPKLVIRESCGSNK